MKKFRLSVLAFVLVMSSSAVFAQGWLKKAKDAVASKTGSLTTDEVAQGLKEALAQGASKGSDQASQTDGFFKNPLIKIPLPPEMQQVEEKLRAIGMGNKVDQFELSLNRAAEDASTQAKPIFVNAIKKMTVQDAFGILKGNNDAATQYLKNTTTPDLTSAFSPIIQSSLDKVSATKYYSELVNTYNKLPLVKKLNPDLSQYATQKAIDGIFTLVAQEEANIRANPAARTSDLLKKVFNQ